MEICYRYKDIIKADELEEIKNKPTQNRINTGYKAPIKQLVNNTKKNIKGKKPTEYDQLLYKDFHRTFKNLPSEILRDMRFWNYLYTRPMSGPRWRRSGRPSPWGVKRL